MIIVKLINLGAQLHCINCSWGPAPSTKRSLKSTRLQMKLVEGLLWGVWFWLIPTATSQPQLYFWISKLCWNANYELIKIYKSLWIILFVYCPKFLHYPIICQLAKILWVSDWVHEDWTQPMRLFLLVEQLCSERRTKNPIRRFFIYTRICVAQ